MVLDGYTFAAPPVDGMRVVIGLRPEHFHIGPEAAPHAARFDLTLRMVERTGSDAILSLNFAGGWLAVRAAPDQAAKMKTGQTVSVDYPKTKLNLFDAQTGRRL